MNRVPSKAFIAVAALVAIVLGASFLLRRTPACEGDGKFMSTQSDCQGWGVAAETCAAAIAKAREAAARSAPRSDNLFACETSFSDCFEAASGGFYPRPSFCLRAADKSAAPSEIRYLQYESDRMNRKKTREVRIN
jgi:uncharacterized protein YgiB involved in biofilm formation